MVIIEFIEKDKLIQFSIASRPSEEQSGPLLVAEESRLLKNLQEKDIPLTPSKKRGKKNGFDDYQTSNVHYTVKSKHFSSLQELITVALDGFVKDEAKLFFFCKNKPFSYMFVNNSYKQLIALHVAPICAPQRQTFRC